MPSTVVKGFAEKTGKSVKEVEKKWDEAKAIAAKSYKESDPKYYAIVTSILKKMLNINEGLMSYREFLVEYVFLEKKFIKNLENYIFKNDPKYIKGIAKEKNSIPAMFRGSKTVYRGMILDEKSYSMLDKGLKLKNFSSWSTDPKIAERFVSDKKKVVSGSNKTGKKVIFKKQVNSEVLLDVRNFLLYLDGAGKLDDFDELTKKDGLDEYEILVDKGITITKKDIFKELKG